MKVFVILSVLFAAAVAQLNKEPIYAPIPYSFNYISETEDGGKSGHEETGDGSGRVTGSYTVSNPEGHARVVDYIADADGFRATIRSNEPKTGPIYTDPASVTIESSAAGTASLNSAAIHRPARPAAGRTGVRYVLVPVNQ